MSNRPRDIARVTKPIVRPLPEQARASGYVLIDDDLHCTVPINVAQAALGTDIDLLTFDGLETVKIPEGTQSGARVKLRNLGVPRLQGSGRGDKFTF